MKQTETANTRHVVIKDLNRRGMFYESADYHGFLRYLCASVHRHAGRLHAYALLPDHVHLLLSADRAGAISQALRRAGQTYVQSFNQRHGRVGTLWQGRFKSCLVDTDAYVLRVIRSIELNPVRAAMVAKPEDYPWSSVHTHLGTAQDPLIVPHPVCMGLGPSRDVRAAAWRHWLHAPLDPDETSRIRAYMAQERALGEPRFQAMVEKTLNRPAAVRRRGRPVQAKDVEGTVD